MSERKVLNKYFPPDFDPAKLKRRKGVKDPQQTVRLMAPFSMRCNRCGEYIYKGKKFNARKETAQGEEYYGLKIFRFYIRCTLCSSEITFKTDPKNADYTMEHGATRNFENWNEADASNRTAMPDAAADDEYDSDGNPVESKRERDAMADLERAQEVARHEMEVQDELSDLRQRNARLELSNANADPESLLSALHAERESAEEEARRRKEQEEDDEMVAMYFAKIKPAKIVDGDGAAVNLKVKGKGKGKAKVEDPADDEEGEADGVKVEDGGDKGEEEEDEEREEEVEITVKRRIFPGQGAKGEPTVASILAAKGKVLDSHAAANGNGSGVGSGAVASALPSTSAMPAPAAAKRKREGMQKLLGIKKKVKA